MLSTICQWSIESNVTIFISLLSTLFPRPRLLESTHVCISVAHCYYDCSASSFRHTFCGSKKSRLQSIFPVRKKAEKMYIQKNIFAPQCVIFYLWMHCNPPYFLLVLLLPLITLLCSVYFAVLLPIAGSRVDDMSAIHSLIPRRRRSAKRERCKAIQPLTHIS